MKLRRPPEGTPALYAQDGKGYEAIVHAHYFVGGSDWLVTEYDPDQDIAFGWACLNGDRQMAELGYVSIAELDSVRFPVTMTNAETGETLTWSQAGRVEIETDWKPVPLREAIALLDGRQGRG